MPGCRVLGLHHRYGSAKEDAIFKLEMHRKVGLLLGTPVRLEDPLSLHDPSNRVRQNAQSLVRVV